MIGRWERILLSLSMILTAGTGLLYAWMKYCMTPEDPFSVVNHPWQPGLLSAHVLAAPLLLFGLGLITREHILGRYPDPRAKRKRPTGVVATAAVVPMVASGYLLQVLTSGPARWAGGLVHLASGILFVAAYGLHLAVGKRKGSSEKGTESAQTWTRAGDDQSMRRRVSRGGPH